MMNENCKICLFDTYRRILSDDSRWNSTLNVNIEHDFPDMLVHPHSYNFIFENLYYDANLRPLALELHKFRKKIPDERISHTVSLYLLGISVAEVIGFEQFNLLLWDRDQRRKFLHHWAAVCMFHDVGYALEENPSSFGLKGSVAIDDLIEIFELEYDLTKGDATDLIRKYYSYRSQKREKIDHGIAGAMLLYNALMKCEAKMQKYEANRGIIFSEKPMYGDKIREDIKRFALEIGRHNMWFADEERIDEYKDFGLIELLPKEDRSHRISFAESPMLFLLCLLDTVEPIKTNSDKSKTLEGVLKDSVINVEKRGNRIQLQFDNKAMWKKAEGCEDWLDIKICGDSEIEFSAV